MKVHLTANKGSRYPLYTASEAAIAAFQALTPYLYLLGTPRAAWELVQGTSEGRTAWRICNLQACLLWIPGEEVYAGNKLDCRFEESRENRYDLSAP